MSTNEIYKKLVRLLHLRDVDIAAALVAGGYDPSRNEITAWRRNEAAKNYQRMPAACLDALFEGLIATGRWRDPGDPPEPLRDVIVRYAGLADEEIDIGYRDGVGRWWLSGGGLIQISGWQPLP